jgi:hypothetical protein
MNKGLPIVLSIPARFKKDRAAVDKGEKKPRQVFALVKQFVLHFVKNRFTGKYPLPPGKIPAP